MNTLIMGSYTDVKNLIISNIKANGQREITGPILQDVLLNMLENSSRVEEITYSDLKALRDDAKLIPSRLYRITDYITTTVQSNTKSAGHPFDIIVLAISESELLERAWGIQHEGDTYFANSNLSAWKLWYCLDNDTTRFAWADATNGKGVIYRMIDEWNNDAPYDFKNIQYTGSWGYWAYTFNWINDDIGGGTCEDLSVAQYAHMNAEGGYTHTRGNIINPCQSGGNGNYGLPLKLNFCIFLNTESYAGNIFYGCYSNVFGHNCYNNTFNNECYNNTFGKGCYGNVFNDGCYNNTFGDTCHGNNLSEITLGSSCSYNTFGNNCNGNFLASSCSYNLFRDYCENNTLGNDCSYNTFASNNSNNTFGYGCNSNTFNVNCHNNTLGDYCSNNTFETYCLSNTFGYGGDSNYFKTNCQNNVLVESNAHNIFGYACWNNTLGENCQYNTFGTYCTYNTLGSTCWYNSLGTNCKSNNFGTDCWNNSFDNNCSYIKFASDSSASTKYNYYQNNHFGDGCQYILFKGDETASDSAQVKNYNFAQGLQGTSDKYLTIDGKRNRTYDTYISKDTDGTIKESVIAEFENKLGNCVDLTSEQTITAGKIFSAGIDLNGTRISKVGSPINTDDVTNKEYVDTQVKTVEDKVNDFKNAGYLYAGIATPETSIGTPEANVFYIANGKGTYTNFGGIEVTEDDVIILYYDTEWRKVSTGIASNEKLDEFAHKDEVRHIERDLGMYPELEPIPLNPEVTGKYINSDGKYVDASGWNVASIGAVYLGNTYLLNMVSSANMVLGVALFVSRVYKRDKEGKIIGTTLTPLFSAKNTSIPASGYVLFEAMDDYEEVLICYKPELTTQMLVARWGFKASHATQLRNLRLIVDNKTDFEGIYELLTAGYALNLVGKGNGEPQAFLSRKTGGGNITDGSAVIKEVDGVQPIVWNQLAFTPRMYYFQGGSTDKFTASILNNVITITATSERSGISSTEGYCGPMYAYKYILGHRYFLTVKVNPSVDVEYRCHLSDPENGATIVTLQANKWSRVSLVSTLVKTSFGEVFFGMPRNVSVGDTIQLKEFEVTDLTQMFGAGNEPSTYEEYLNRISHYHIKDTYAYNEGEIVNYRGTGIKTTGRNIWDEEWELGGIDAQGQNDTNPNRLRSKNYIPCFGGMNYYFHYGGSNSGTIYYYDSNKQFISADLAGANRIKTTPINANYIRFYIYRSGITTYNHDICINISDPAFNGQYEPYKSYVRDWSEVMKKYFPDGMTSLNGVKDFFNERKAVRKFGVVDLGTLAWSRIESGDHYFFSTTAISDKADSTINMICAKYKNGGTTYDSNAKEDKTLYASLTDGDAKKVYIRDDAYTTAESFKAAMAGVLLFYELAEPVEDIFEKPLNLTYTVINGGTETSLATENSTQFEGSIAYNKDYVAVVDELQLQNRVTQIEFENWEN